MVAIVSFRQGNACLSSDRPDLVEGQKANRLGLRQPQSEQLRIFQHFISFYQHRGALDAACAAPAPSPALRQSCADALPAFRLTSALRDFVWHCFASSGVALPTLPTASNAHGNDAAPLPHRRLTKPCLQVPSLCSPPDTSARTTRSPSKASATPHATISARRSAHRAGTPAGNARNRYTLPRSRARIAKLRRQTPPPATPTHRTSPPTAPPALARPARNGRASSAAPPTPARNARSPAARSAHIGIAATVCRVRRQSRKASEA